MCHMLLLGINREIYDVDMAQMNFAVWCITQRGFSIEGSNNGIHSIWRIWHESVTHVHWLHELWGPKRAMAMGAQ